MTLEMTLSQYISLGLTELFAVEVLPPRPLIYINPRPRPSSSHPSSTLSIYLVSAPNININVAQHLNKRPNPFAHQLTYFLIPLSTPSWLLSTFIDSFKDVTCPSTSLIKYRIFFTSQSYRTRERMS